jgi:hypothetical protein
VPNAARRVALVPMLLVMSCTASHHASSTASPSASPSATTAPTLAPISVRAEPGRVVALPVRTGSGTAHLRLRPFKGPFELMVSCVGGGGATFILGDTSNSIDCQGVAVGNDIETGRVADSLTIQAAPTQGWRVAVLTGHTPIQ